MLRLARETMVAGGVAPAIYNAANEVAVAAFLDRRIGFTAIHARDHMLGAVVIGHRSGIFCFVESAVVEYDGEGGSEVAYVNAVRRLVVFLSGKSSGNTASLIRC